MRIFISGCYGTPNVGDEAILESLVSIANATYCNPEIIVSSINPDRTEELHNINKAIVTIERNPIQWIRSVRSVDRILLGGGSLIGGDFIYRHSVIVSVAKLLKIPVGYAAAGITFCDNERLRGQLIQEVDFVTVRDVESAEYAAKYVPAESVKQISDPGYYKGQYNELEKEQNDTIVVCGKYVSRDTDGTDIDGLVDALNGIDESLSVEFVPCNYSADREFCFEASAKLERESKVIDKEFTHEEFQKKLSQSRLVVGMRLHSIIMAIRGETPFVGISYHPKCTNILRNYGVEEPHMFDNIDSDKLFNDILNQLEEGSSEELKKYSRSRSNDAAKIYDVIENELEDDSKVRRLSNIHIYSLFNSIKYIVMED